MLVSRWLIVGVKMTCYVSVKVADCVSVRMTVLVSWWLPVSVSSG